MPPGEVTASRSSTGCSPDSRSIRALPTAVCTMSSAATARGRPNRMPASIIASTRKKKYAGPLPDRAVTASCCDSGTRTTLPTGLSRSSTTCRCSSPACEPGEIADIASSTKTGVLVMTRTTGVPSGSSSSTSDEVMPAAIDTTSAPGRRCVATSPSSVRMSWGLTTRSTTSATATASSGLGVATPYRSAISAARPWCRSAASSELAGSPERSRPDSSASPSLPTPRTAISVMSGSPARAGRTRGWPVVRRGVA